MSQTTKKVYDIFGSLYSCYFYNNGYDQGVTIFTERGDMAFKFDEPVKESQIHLLLKGYHIGSKRNSNVGQKN